MIMLRKALIALAAVASVGLLAPDMAQARGGGGGGHGFGGGGHGFGGGFHGGGFHGGGFHRGFGIGAFALGAGLGYGLYGPYGYYDGYGAPYYGDYYADDGGYGGCYVVRQRVHTRYGWRIRPVEVCR
jgi:hypothetical protein